MTFTSFDAVFFTVAFLVPGFIWESVLSLFLRRRDDHADRAWVRFLTLSAFNYALWSWLIYLLFVRVGVLAEPWMAALAWFFMLLVSPVAFGVATGLLSQRAVVRRLLARYGVYTVHPVPTAWDYVFSHSTLVLGAGHPFRSRIGSGGIAMTSSAHVREGYQPLPPRPAEPTEQKGYQPQQPVSPQALANPPRRGSILRH